MAASTDLVGVNKIANDILSTAAAGPTFGGNYSLEIGGKFVTSATGNRFLTNNIGSGKILIMKDIDINTDVSSPRTLTIAGSGDTIISGIIANGNGAQANRITITNTGVTTLSGNNTYTGVTTLSAGMTVFANTSAKTAAMATAAASASVGLGVGGAGYYSSANVDSLFSGNLTGFSMDAASGVGIDTTAGNFTYSTSQNSTRALTKLGSNSLTLTGNSNYGATTVRAGTLVVNGTVGGSGGLTVRNGGTLGGNGTVNKAVIVESGGTLSPGNSPGALSQGATTLNGGGNYNWQVYDATMGQEGIGFDTINLTTGSALTIASTDLSKFNINLWSLSGIAPDVNGNAINFDNTQTYTWTLFATDQTIANFSADKFQINVASINGTSGFSNALGGGLFSVELGDGNTDLVLRFTAVPEPATWLLLAGSLTCVLVMRRRRR
jgi:autotransporter-associated beta strand protein